MAFSPITSWEIDGETMETVSDFSFGGEWETRIHRNSVLSAKFFCKPESALRNKICNFLSKKKQKKNLNLQSSENEMFMMVGHWGDVFISKFQRQSERRAPYITICEIQFGIKQTSKRKKKKQVIQSLKTKVPYGLHKSLPEEVTRRFRGASCTPWPPPWLSRLFPVLRGLCVRTGWCSSCPPDLQRSTWIANNRGLHKFAGGLCSLAGGKSGPGWPRREGSMKHEEVKVAEFTGNLHPRLLLFIFRLVGEKAKSRILHKYTHDKQKRTQLLLLFSG